MSKIDVFLSREKREEGQRVSPYDDATGLTVKAPVGKLTWGRGYCLEAIGEPALFDVIDRFLVGKHDAYLSQFTWYVALDDVCGSVPLDIAYNAGDSGEIHKFPNMIAAFERGDIAEAANQCRVADPRLDTQRYAPLRQILLTCIARK